MANTAISNLLAATTPLAGTEVLPIVQSGATDQVTVANLTAGRAVSALSYASTTGATFATSSGNVGIGTASPLVKLVVSNGGANGLEINPAATTTLTTYNRSTLAYSALRVTANVFTIQTGAVTPTTTFTLDSSGNVGIGTTAPNASAILDVQSTTKGVRMPNMTTAQKNAITSPAAGLMVFDTTLAKLCVYTGAAWETITSI